MSKAFSHLQLLRYMLCSSCLFSICKVSPVEAQVTSDNTTGTQIETNGNVAEITGGDTRGENLFHSFQEFSVPTGNEAFFNNADSIGNIFSRVTGGNISNIDGLIRGNGSANLFLINPAGIMFGENASLSIGGSFYGSTADSIVFEGGEFSTNLDNPPLLTINAPIGFSFRDNPGDITNDGATLEVNAETTLALLGGNLNFDGGAIVAFGSNVQLGGLTEAGTISLNDDGSLSFPEAVARGNVSLTNSAQIFVVGNEGGSIDINAKNLSLTSQINFFAGINIDSGFADAQAGDVAIDLTEDLVIDNSSITNTNFGMGNGGDVRIEARNVLFTNGGRILNPNNGIGNLGSIIIAATEDITFEGVSSPFISGVSTFLLEQATGTIGEINLTAQNLNLIDGGAISSIVSGNNNSGDINLDIVDTIRIDDFGLVTSSDGTQSEFPSSINTNVADGNGNSGNLNINAQNLLLNNEGFISVANFGQGNSGNIEINVDSLSITEASTITGRINGAGNGSNITINAQNSVSVVGNNDFFSSIAVDVAQDATGEAGNIEINTAKLTLTDAFISADVVGDGNGGSIDITATDSIELSNLSLIQTNVSEGSTGSAGDLNLKTQQLTLTEGSQISASTSGNGNAGDVTIVADESISLSGISNNSRGGIFAGALIENGTGGDIDLTTSGLTISDGATITASNFSSLGVEDGGSEPGTGEPGNITISADNLNASEGRIEAITQAETGTGGNIDLRVAEIISLTGNSFISAEARGNANGGNLSIDTNFIIAFPDGSNDIIARAEQGEGGNIDIIVESLLGIQERPLNPFSNDINASSEFGLDGNISINSPDINPLQGTTELSTNVVETEETVAQICSASRNGIVANGLSITGKGGVPPAPDLPLNSASLIDNSDIASISVPPPLKTSGGDIQPARGIKVTESGKVVLTAYRTDNQGTRLAKTNTSCGLR